MKKLSPCVRVVVTSSTQRSPQAEADMPYSQMFKYRMIQKMIGSDVKLRMWKTLAFRDLPLH